MKFDKFIKQQVDNISWPEPSSQLMSRTMDTILAWQLANSKRKALFFGFVTIASVAVFVVASKLFVTNLINSGFLQYGSLLFSDWQTVMSDWQNYTYSLLDSLPAMDLAYVCLSGLLLLWSSKNLFLDFGLVKQVKLLANH